MTDQTGAQQRSASNSRTGDVDVADESRPDTTTDVQTGGATDVGAGGPELSSADNESAPRGPDDVDAPRGDQLGTERDTDRDPTNTDSGTDSDSDSIPTHATTTTPTDSDTRATDRDMSGVATHATTATPTDSHTAATERDTSDEDRAAAQDRAAAEDDAAEEERQKSPEEFAREHDPAQHDVSAGEEFRQPGDWTADDAGGAQVWDAEGNLVEGSAPGQTGQTAETTGSGRRTSSLEEVRDGGYGVGSAAPLDDRAMPLGHPIKAWEDTKTFVTPEDEGYNDAEPHVWFTDADAAERADFRHVD
jgi:hypothetical protein